MTDPVLRLEETNLVVQPGGQVRTRVTVSNPGTIVEGYRLEVLGDVAGWAEVTPPEVQVYPQQEASAVVVVSPPAGSGSPSGTFPFAVRARSVVDPASQATEEGDVEIGAVFGLQSKLTPVTSSGRWSAGHAIELTNWGNSTERLHLAATDPDERLAFLVHPEHMHLPVGSTAVASIRVRPRKPLWRGSPVRLPFQVVAEPEGAQPGPPPPPGTEPRRATLDGAIEQRPVLARGVVVVATAAVVLLGALVGWAFNRPHPPASALSTDAAVSAPTEVAAESAGPETVRVSWGRPDRVPDAYTIYVVDPATTGQPIPRTIAEHADISGELQEHPVDGLETGTEYCFQVVAQRSESRSVHSAPACVAPVPEDAETAAPTTDPTAPDTAATAGPLGSGEPSDGATDATEDTTATTGAPSAEETAEETTGGEQTSTVADSGGELAPDDWVAVIYVAVEDGAVTGGADRVLEQLRAEDFDAARLESDEYPEMGFRPDNSVVYVHGGFADADAVERFCEANPRLQEIGNAGCRPYRPGPRAD